VLIDRRPEARTEDPVAQMAAALDEGSSLILFPEGQRNSSDDSPLLPFKSGLYHLARQPPGVDLVPVWISNLNHVMPKGEDHPGAADLHADLRRSRCAFPMTRRRMPSSPAPLPPCWRCLPAGAA
jgi:1-acyl-sn-glycerol-3-phosphate acyltransferase